MEEGGCVLSSAIDKYIFVTVKKRFDTKLRIGYTQTEMVDHIDEIHHELIREALRVTGVSQGLEVTTMGDIPSEGSGLGSSSTVTVGVLQALYTYLGDIVSKDRLAKEACDIEIGKLGKPIGIQDQYIAAYGNLRFFEFCPDGSVRVEKLELPTDLRHELNDRFLLFFTGISRRADSVLTEQKSNIKDRLDVLREIKQIAYQAKSELQNGNLDGFGTLLHQTWELKKRMAGPISNGMIDEIYNAARKAGAVGGKITGAGGGGFILLYAPHEKHQAIRNAMGELQELPFQLESDGSKVIFNYRR